MRCRPHTTREAIDAGGNRVEQLANISLRRCSCRPTLERYGGWSSSSGDELTRRLNRVADQLQVTASALKWRLIALGALSRASARSGPMRRFSTTAKQRRQTRLRYVLQAVHGGDGFGHGPWPRLLPACGRAPRREHGGDWRRCSPLTASSTPNVIIESHRVDSWRALAGGYRVETVDECVAETQAGAQHRPPGRRIEEEGTLRTSLGAVHSVSDREHAELALW